MMVGTVEGSSGLPLTGLIAITHTCIVFVIFENSKLNHDCNPNAQATAGNFNNYTLDVMATRDIAAGEEVTAADEADAQAMIECERCALWVHPGCDGINDGRGG